MKTKYLYLVCSIFIIMSCESNIKKFEESGYKITNKQALDLYTNYNSKLKPTITKLQNENKLKLGLPTNHRATEYLWISMEDLKGYIKFLEEVERRNSNQPKISGIGIYFGAYNNNKTLEDDKQYRISKRVGDYKSRLTNFFTPTFKDEGQQYNNVQYQIYGHKPFYIKPNINQEDPYLGTYVKVPFFYDPLGPQLFNPNADPNGDFLAGTSLNLNELNAIPPKL